MKGPMCLSSRASSAGYRIHDLWVWGTPGSLPLAGDLLSHSPWTSGRSGKTPGVTVGSSGTVFVMTQESERTFEMSTWKPFDRISGWKSVRSSEMSSHLQGLGFH